MRLVLKIVIDEGKLIKTYKKVRKITNLIQMNLASGLIADSSSLNDK